MQPMAHPHLSSGSGPFLPQGHLFHWLPDLVWLHAISDLILTIAYISISITLVIVVRKSRNLPYRWVFRMFSAFLLFCGFTHFVGLINIWTPLHYLEGFLKAATAALSLSTALLLIPLTSRITDPTPREGPSAHD